MINSYEVPPPERHRSMISDYQVIEKRVDESINCVHKMRVVKNVGINGNTTFYKQCAICGFKGPRIFNRDLSRQAMIFAGILDKASEEKYYAMRQDIRHKLDDADRAKDYQNWNAWYEKYLQSTVWLEKHDLVMKRANGICEGCLKEKAVVVHHVTYDHAGSEYLFELVALCNGCHTSIHS
jgi:hypothetical protein